MRSSLRLVCLALVSVAAAAGCPAELDAVCGLSPELPAVEEGRGTATVDGADFNEAASWAPGSSASITIGLLDLIVPTDEFGASFDQLLEDNALPFCARLGEQSETVGKAIFNESPTFVSDAGHSGGVAVLAREGNVLIGRFEVEVKSSAGGATKTFTEGAFRALRR